MKIHPLLLSICLLASTAQADVGLYSTGVNDAGVPLATGETDTHYTLVSGADGATSFAVDDAAGYPGYWIAPSGTSKWITPRISGGFAADGDPSGGSYVYQTSFNLSGIDLASASITGQVAADNEISGILLNGNSIGLGTAVGYSGYTGFSISSGFVDGVNTLSFLVNNYSGPTGLRAELAGNFTAGVVPEPGSWALMAAGITLLAWRRRAG